MTNHPLSLYNDSLSLLTDLYQITMAYGYWKNNLHSRRSVFNLFFRKNPFGGKFAITAGLEYAVDLVTRLRFKKDDTDFLANLLGQDGRSLFEREFLDYLERMEPACTVDAIPEGSVVFAHEPLLQISGPIIQCQLLETALLNVINFQTLIATKAARVCRAAAGDRVVEFGLRRAQGIDGGLAASRAAHIGGCSATSNVLAGKLFGIPVVGTHAHSWVMSFPSEKEAFRAYAEAMPNNCVFLVDTYDTIEGVRNAITEGAALRARGHEMIGIRLDSGDLCALSIEARAMLDAAGFPNCSIVASNDLDEYKIAKLKADGARIDTWGVGTSLVTGDGQPALGGVYKLGAIDNGSGQMIAKIKRSNDPIKTSNPGITGVHRYSDDEGMFKMDVIVSKQLDASDHMMISGEDPIYISDMYHREELLIRYVDGGRRVFESGHSMQEIVKHREDQMARFEHHLEKDRPDYRVGVDCTLDDLKREMVKKVYVDPNY